jgi:chorismate mutase
MTTKLDILRKDIDNLDAELADVVSRRMKVIPQVAAYKKANGIVRCQPGREQEVITSIRNLAKSKGDNPDLLEAIMRLIIADAHRIEKEIIGE